MSIANKLDRLETARQDIITALYNKNIDADGHGIEHFAQDIDNISENIRLIGKTVNTNGTYIASDEGIMPNDYKIYCFNGKARIILVCSEREESLKLTFFDVNWNELNYGTEAFKATKPVKKPKHLNKMLEYAEKLAQPFKFVRVDFYEEEDKILFGELTFTPARCSAEYYNNLGNKELGQMLDLGDI
jgi:hypothetical protein